jgi:hypothetical protein
MKLKATSKVDSETVVIVRRLGNEDSSLSIFVGRAKKPLDWSHWIPAAIAVTLITAVVVVMLGSGLTPEQIGIFVGVALKRVLGVP